MTHRGQASNRTAALSAVFQLEAMSKNLVIVESPAKAKTISKYLGKDFDVLASYGHVRDLVPKEGAVDTDNGFTMKYQLIERNEKHVNAIMRALKKADALYLDLDADSLLLRRLVIERGHISGLRLDTARSTSGENDICLCSNWRSTNVSRGVRARCSSCVRGGFTARGG